MTDTDPLSIECSRISQQSIFTFALIALLSYAWYTTAAADIGEASEIEAVTGAESSPLSFRVNCVTSCGSSADLLFSEGGASRSSEIGSRYSSKSILLKFLTGI